MVSHVHPCNAHLAKEDAAVRKAHPKQLQASAFTVTMHFLAGATPADGDAGLPPGPRSALSCVPYCRAKNNVGTRRSRHHGSRLIKQVGRSGRSESPLDSSLVTVEVAGAYGLPAPANDYIGTRARGTM